MKISFKSSIIFGMALLSFGIFLGWVFFKSDDSDEDEKEVTVENSTEQVWTCSMHPQIRKNEAGDCPICGMDLIPLDESQNNSIDPDAIEMTATAKKIAAIQTLKLERSNAKKELILNGKIEKNKKLAFTQSAYYAGRIENLFTQYEGQYVRKGTVIAKLYAPELVNVQKELLEAYKLRNSQPQLYQSVREKLRSWKIPDSSIDRIISRQEVSQIFPLTAQYNGYVNKIYVEEGMYIDKGQPLIEIISLSTVWVDFDLYETDLQWLSVGDSVEYTINALPGKTFTDGIEFIDPVINANTRVASARITLKNPELKIKPGMLVTGKAMANLAIDQPTLLVPKSAVLWTGTRSVVYEKINNESGLYFKMREITLGPELDNGFMVESGIEEGTEIARSGAFSIDAAAQLGGKPSMMSFENAEGDLSIDETAAKSYSSKLVNKTDKKLNSPEKFQESIRKLFQTYILLKDALIIEDYEKASTAAEDMNSLLKSISMDNLIQETHEVWMKDSANMQKLLNYIIDSENIDEQRNYFYPLSDQLYHSLKKYQINVDAYRQYCPMAFDNKGAYWLSTTKEIQNPYFGDEMLKCGSTDEEINSNNN